VRNGYERPGPLLLIAVGVLVNWLSQRVGVAWALLVAVVMLGAYAIHLTRNRPSYLLTEDGGYLLTESGDRFLLE
jgi:hypothetical protein